MRMKIDAGWRGESESCLLWALGHRAEITPYDQEVDIEDAISSLPDESCDKPLAGACLRSSSEIDAARDTAELWHWRSRTRQLQESGSDFRVPNGRTIDGINESTARKYAGDGKMAAPCWRRLSRPRQAVSRFNRR